MLRVCFLVGLAFATACAGSTPEKATNSPRAAKSKKSNLPPLLSELSLAPGQLQASDGADDGTSLAVTPELRKLVARDEVSLVDLGRPEGGHPLICDIVGFDGAVYVSTAVRPIDLDGAMLYRWTGTEWKLAFDWDRGGAPGKTHEVGGQGISRLRVIGERMYGTDSDAPLFGGFGFTDVPFEDYLFVAEKGRGFGELQENQAPPKDTIVMPLAFHAFDVIEFKGAMVATGGSVSVSGKPGTRYPGGLFVGETGSQVLIPKLFPGEGKRVGVVRTTYLQRFRGRLYVGFQNNSRRIRWDLGVLEKSPLQATTSDLKLGRVSDDGGWLTRRFAVGGGRLYWVAGGYKKDKRGGAVFVSEDGLDFRRLTLPKNAGDPQDLLVIDKVVLLLTDRGVYRAGPKLQFRRWLTLPEGAIAATDNFCSAPLTVANGAIFIGGSGNGHVYRLAAL